MTVVPNPAFHSAPYEKFLVAHRDEGTEYAKMLRIMTTIRFATLEDAQNDRNPVPQFVAIEDDE